MSVSLSEIFEFNSESSFNAVHSYMGKIVVVDVEKCCNEIVAGHRIRLAQEEHDVSDEGEFWLLMMGIRHDVKIVGVMKEKCDNSAVFRSTVDRHFGPVMDLLSARSGYVGPPRGVDSIADEIKRVRERVVAYCRKRD
jgi:hypothetical protein